MEEAVQAALSVGKFYVTNAVFSTKCGNIVRQTQKLRRWFNKDPATLWEPKTRDVVGTENTGRCINTELVLLWEPKTQDAAVTQNR